MSTPPRIRIDLASSVPAYRQIAAAVRSHLVEGRVRPGESLPTVRRLAVDLGVNHNTVADAYRVLADEGWLDLRQGRGATVRDRRQPRAGSGRARAFGERLREILTEAVAEGVAPEALRRELKRAAAGLAPAGGRS